MDTQLKLVVISSSFTLLTTIIAVGIAQYISKKWLNQEELKKNLATAKSDILFLLELEEEVYKDIQMLTNGKHSSKRKYRAKVMSMGFVWSGLFTKSKVRP